ncbi:MAG: cytochrome b/b6 domain-containing protein [Sulfurimicrobium sp.]|jgi:cytochrome b subunit of formate dehydrogenase|nr:cytochrome b/b6 domain-containing protein [Sulfurimicrobium sp.]MDP1704489.1 cytochrome b/b6 domain-containing protein [Sulfurimicrobium sp.]MDP2199178.1 cytochrome b/b6 domain-containing protein [Sulfurimicrobium sp.]
MKLSQEAREVLDTAKRHNRVSPEEDRDIEEVVALLPDDRSVLYKNVDSNPIGDFYRYNIHIRIQHLLIFSTFLLLAFTGLPIHYNTAFWAEPFNSVLGGLEVTRVIHRTLAAAMIFAMLYHFVTIGLGSLLKLRARVFELRRTILPVWKDIRDFKEDMQFFRGKRPVRPEMDKFMYKQKIHYFAAGFGNTVMVISGSTFLFPDVWASILPVEMASHFQEMMRLSHPHEALLALLVIAFWHWYNVHLAPGRFPMQWTFLTGKITREHQIEEHFLEYLRCIVTMPEERSYLRKLIESKKMWGTQPHD